MRLFITLLILSLTLVGCGSSSHETKAEPIDYGFYPDLDVEAVIVEPGFLMEGWDNEVTVRCRDNGDRPTDPTTVTLYRRVAGEWVEVESRPFVGLDVHDWRAVTFSLWEVRAGEVVEFRVVFTPVAGEKDHSDNAGQGRYVVQGYPRG